MAINRNLDIPATLEELIQVVVYVTEMTKEYALDDRDLRPASAQMTRVGEHLAEAYKELTDAETAEELIGFAYRQARRAVHGD